MTVLTYSETISLIVGGTLLAVLGFAMGRLSKR